MTILEATARPFGARFRGGGERYPHDLAREMSQREAVIFACIPDPRDPSIPGLTSILLPGWSLAAPPFFSELNPIPTPRTFRRMRHLLDSHQTDLEILHLHNLRTAYTAAWIGAAKSRPSRARFRVLLTDHGARFMPFPQFLAREIDFYAAVSKYSLGQLQAWAPRPGVVVPPFVPNSFLAASDQMADTARDVDLLYLGRLVPWKRADLLLELTPRIERILGRGVHVVIAGAVSDPSYLAQLRQRASRASSRSRVEFVINPDDDGVARLYARSRTFLLLSTRSDEHGRGAPVPELAPASPLEAAAFGTPAVASAIPGVDEQVLDGRTGLLVEPSRLDAAATAVASLLSDDTLWRRLSSNAREFVRTERTVGVVAKLLESYIARIRRGTA